MTTHIKEKINISPQPACRVPMRLHRLVLQKSGSFLAWSLGWRLGLKDTLDSVTGWEEYSRCGKSTEWESGVEVRGRADHIAILPWNPLNISLQQLDLARAFQIFFFPQTPRIVRKCVCMGRATRTLDPSALRFSLRFRLEEGFSHSWESWSALSVTICGKVGFEGFHPRESADLCQQHVLHGEGSLLCYLPTPVKLISESHCFYHLSVFSAWPLPLCLVSHPLLGLLS